ncbi:MAG: cyclic nucleotide-binding domain-containing protein [Gammaproteobacteria bacterium]|nr:cyclic nucleotide-binding domain-containing protein [Gammaproteobacteria bacterium]
MNDMDYNNIPPELSEQEMSLLFSLSVQREFKDKDIIFTENGLADSMFIIAKGSVSILRDNEGEIRELVRLSEADFLGEMALLGDGTRNATAQAEGEVVLWEIDREMFATLLLNDKLLADKLMAANKERGGRYSRCRKLR